MTEVVFAQGDITRFAADAIVNAANSAIAGGGGVDGAIHRTGGPVVMADLERRYGPGRHCPTGSAVVSDAGDLPARIARATVDEWVARQSDAFDSITFVLFSADTLEAFRRAGEA